MSKELKNFLSVRMSHCAAEVVAQKFQSGKTEDDAILIDWVLTIEQLIHLHCPLTHIPE